MKSAATTKPAKPVKSNAVKVVKKAITKVRQSCKEQKKPERRLIALHRKVNAGIDGDGSAVFYAAEGDKVTGLKGIKIDQFFNELRPGDVLRMTSTNLNMHQIDMLSQQAVDVYTCHWHKAGIDKGLAPENIAKAFLDLPEEKLTKVKIRHDLAWLRILVQSRMTLMDYRKGANLQVMSIARSLNLKPADPRPAELDWLVEMEEGVKETEKKSETKVEKAIAKTAAAIMECRDLNDIMAISEKSWMTSATVVAFLGDISRFKSVSSLWHYCGYHVVDGKAPKRQKGVNSTWNPKVRTALWSWSDSMLKTNNPRWRPRYNYFLEQEKKAHAQKCLNCKTPDGHCGARARRKVVKEVLKEFFLRAKS